MPSRTVENERRAPTLPFALLIALLIVLWLAGGASRVDVPGQFVVRGAAWIVLLVLLFRRPWPKPGAAHAPILLLLGSVGLVALQLVPLPPGLWRALPGRAVLEGSAAVAGQAQPWRPLSISPEATRNALGSLVVPVAVFAALLWLDKRQHRKLMILLAAAIILSALLALFQFTGANFDNPMINDVAGERSGSFANRNHLSLFAAIGCLLAPTVCLEKIGKGQLALALSLGLVILFLLATMASGSRTGIVLVTVGTVLGALAARSRLVREFRSLPRTWSIALAAGAALAVAGTIALSVVMGRAISIERAAEANALEDTRFAIWSTVLKMSAHYFPAGTGFGTFDPAYRISESTAHLGTKYINQAHNDVLQVALDGGLPGVLLILVTVVWWAKKSWRAWRIDNALLARLGSAFLLLVFVASLVDYPARTPMIMTVVAIGFFWLARFCPDDDFFS